MWLKSQYLKQSQCHFGSKTRYTPSGKKAVFGIGQRRNMLKSRYLTPAFLYAPAGCVLWYSKLSSSMETLTPDVVNKIIKRIEVHNSETMNGHKRVGVDIYFTGVGLVDLATIKEMLAIAESSRP